MATHSVPDKKLQSSLNQEQAGEFRYVARQPILDRNSRVYGYELLAWSGSELALRNPSDVAAQTMLDNTVLFGLEQLARGLPAFVPCTPQSLMEKWVEVLPPELTVLQLPASTEADAKLLDACRGLKAAGFRLALDDFTEAAVGGPLAGLADYLKVDATSLEAGARQALLSKSLDKPVLVIAKGVETQEQFGATSAEGFNLFQGYYFCHPEPVKSHRIPANRLVHLEILELVQNDPFDLGRLSQLVMCDASLTYRLLRLVNSPLCAMRQEVTSIRSALLLVGQETFRRIAMLATASDFSAGEPEEILRMACERGRFCELAAGMCGLEPAEQYLVGMISLFPAMLRISMEDLVRMLPLREKAREALQGGDIKEGILLRWVERQEHGDWAACDAIAGAHGLAQDELIRHHCEAVKWAEGSLKAVL